MKFARCRFLWVALTLIAVDVPSVWATPPQSADAPLVAQQVRQLMQDRDYAGAIEAIDTAAKAKDAPKDYLTYLKGRALFLAGKHDEAVTAFDRLQKEFPASPWVRRARFGKAVALARKGDFRGAESIYRAEAEYLLSLDRKQDLADIYLEFADSYFKPPKEEHKPDYQKALDFYIKSLDVGLKAEKQVEVELLVAQCQQRLGKLDEAIVLYEKFSKEHVDSKLDVDARFRLGECHLAKGQVKEARRAWQDLLAKYSDSSSRRIAEATFNLSRTWRIPQPQNDEELSLGVAALETFLKRFPAHKRAAKAQLDVARSYMHRGRHDDAVKCLTRFLADGRYRQCEEIADARVLLGQAYQLQKKFTEALATWRDYLAKHPAHKRWSDVQREIINTEFLMGQEKAQEKHYDEARSLWSAFLAEYPLDGRDPGILYEFGQMNHRQKKWKEAIADWRRLVSKYPDTNEASLAQYMIGVTREQELGELEEALEEYRKVTWGCAVPQAAQAIARLTAESLAIATERVFRSDEKPKLKLTTRNLEKVTVRAYKVDLQTYFRKMHLARGVEQLDIALIDPDVSFEFEVPSYKKHQQIESTIEVALPGKLASGAMAVTVSSKKLEATSMLLQSDLDVIVKSSRDEVFVFAENMLTGKPWSGATVLISDGMNVFAEETTGKDGVVRKTYKELKAAGDLRVLAVAGGNVASNQLGLQGVGIAQGLSDKGYVYTDRPAYRVGQIVHIRGCLRRAVNDAYAIDKGKAYTIEVFDSRNRLVHQQEITLNEFGSFHDHFVLPPTSPQGPYRVQVRDRDQKTYQGAFLVHEYQLEPIRLVIDTPRTVYYRGEVIEGMIRAEYYYGAPLAGAELRYRLADDRVYTARTDKKGEVRFKLPTREYIETQTLPLVVELPERNLATAANLLLSCRGFSISLGTVRPLYLAGETFEVSLSTRDAQGKPVGRKLTLKVFEQTSVEGKVGERLIESHDLESDAKDGTARRTLKLDKGGKYVLRAEGIDQFSNPIWGQHTVQISDEKDTVRLRILADVHTYKVGDTAKAKLHWRERPTLALVTFQGARILDYRLVALQQGDNTLEIPMTAKLAPNFELAVAAMTDVRSEPKDDKAAPRRFHEASSPFTVQRDLRVSLSVKRKGEGTGPIRPGEDVEVTLTATDPQGKPVSAEISLAMVEQSLLDRFASPLPAIQDFFRGARREPAVRTTSSITFAYHPATRAINRSLLAEADRIEVERAEAESLREGGAAVGAVATGLAGGAVNLPATAAAPPAAYRGARINVASEEVAVQTPALGATLARTSTSGQTPSKVGLSWSAGDYDRQLTEKACAASSASDGRTWFFDGESQREISAVNVNGTLKGIDVRRYAGAVRLGEQQGRVLAMNARGEMFGLSTRALGTEGEVAALGRLGTVVLPDIGPQETGYWNPAVTTDQEGKATVTFTMPERSTAWKLMAKGITTDTLSGEAADALVAKKDLFGQLKLPMAFTDGDEAEIEASIHNDAIAKGKIEVTLKTTVAGRTVEEKRTLEANGKGIQNFVFKTKLQRPEPAKEERVTADVSVGFELTVATDGRRDIVRQSVPLKPYGEPVYATASGTATSDTTAWVEPPSGMSPTKPSLQILIGPTVERSLMDILLSPAPACQLASRRIASGMESVTSDLMAALGLQQLIGGSRETGGPHAQMLDERVRSGVAVLVSSQNDDGGWSWTGQGGASNRYSTARAVWALSLARKAGYVVPEDTLTKSLTYLGSQVAATDNSDYESKAVLLHAMSVAGQGDFMLANRLYRERPALSPAALAHLAMAFAEMDRKATAAELLELLGHKNLDDATLRRTAATGCLPWNSAPAELRALFALALQKVSPRDAKAKELVDWLLAHRTGNRWTPEKATGPAALALCEWFAKNRFEGDRYKLAVSVNDKKIAELDVDPTEGTQTIDVPAGALADGKQHVSFQITGRGCYSYQCILSGFVPADQLHVTTQNWMVQRYYEPGPLELDGREIPRGFDVLQGNYSTFRNPLDQLPVGRRAVVTLAVWRPYPNVPTDTPEEQLEYLVVTEPIPSGATVIEKSVTGPFERFELSPGAITFYVGSRRFFGNIQYELYGYLPGHYRAGPTVVRDAYRPDQFAAAATKSLDVLASGQPSKDEYRLTPRELFELGKRHFEKKELRTAQKHLTELVEKWNVRPDIYRPSIEMLLDTHLELGPPNQVVHYFEIIKEKWPSAEIPFAKILKVGAAYHDLGEFERSYLVFRATVESSFRRESGVAGFLDAQGEFTRSVDVMGRLLREYPPESYIAAATYALAQRVYAKAPEAAGDARLRKEKVNRVDLVRRAWRMLEGFLTAHPEDTAADQAAFSAANALLELKQYPEAIAACERYAKRYKTSDLLDSYWYMIGYCHFATGEHDAALRMCRKVAEARRIDKLSGHEVESLNKWQAVYILGQVHHSLGQAAEAIREYRRVEDRFADAKEAIEYFNRKAIKLPEVTLVKPGQPVEVELAFRNITSCDAKVYRIDLMKFGLLKRNLGGITQINLSGIHPYHEATMRLGDGKDYRNRKKSLAMPLKEEGAYLVVCRGENLHTSGLVLVTPLAVEVQEEVPSGRVRTTVKDLTTDKYVSTVHVKVIGSRNDNFVSGETDLRGVFVADGIQGTSTVMAQAGPARYAFFRGSQELAPAPPQPVPAPPQVQKENAVQPAAHFKGKDALLLENVQGFNVQQQQRGVQELKKTYESKPQGVEAQGAFQ
jgi:alpha-2-macroglobulin